MLGSSNNKLAVDAGDFSVKSINGKFKNSAKFTGKIGNYILRQDAQKENDIHHSLSPIYEKRSDIYSVTSLSDVIMREVNVSRELSAYEVEGAIEVELNESLPFPLDQVYFDFQKSRTSDPDNAEQRYLTAVSRRDIIDPLTSSIVSFDKNVKQIHVDVDAYALGRLIKILYSDILQDDEIVLVIDIAHARSRYYFYDKDDLLFNREQQIGGKFATESIGEIYDLSFEDAQILKHRQDHDTEFNELIIKPFTVAFVEQLNLVIDFFEASGKSDKEVSKVILIGGGACLNGFIEELQTLWNKPVEIIDLSGIWPAAKIQDYDWKSFSANYALALSLLVDGGE